MKLLIIGAGPGGYVGAIRAAQLGVDVTVVEAEEVGGTCLNWGCIPTKTLLASAEVLERIRRGDEYGIQISGEVVPQMEKILARKDRVVTTQAKGIRALFKSRGVRLVEGRARLASPRSVIVSTRDGDSRKLEADAILLATGSRPGTLPGLPFDGEHILSSNEALSLRKIPKDLIIVGAGVVGCEFGFLYRALGSEVVIIEALPRALSTEDPEISGILERELKKKKIRLLKGVRVETVDVNAGCVTVGLSDGSNVAGEKLLVSVGRVPNTDTLGLSDIGVEQGPRGEVPVDERMRTNVEGVYAVGDMTGRLMLAHVASREAIVAVRNITGHDERMDYSVVPAAIFTHPEIGSVGLRENECIDRQMKIRIGRFPIRALGRAHAIGEIAGLIKVIADASNDRVLGVHMIGPNASDLVHEAALAIQRGVTVREIADTIHAHPTLAEGFMEACEDVHGTAIHLPGK